jgi:hypothetical protein
MVYLQRMTERLSSGSVSREIGEAWLKRAVGRLGIGAGHSAFVQKSVNALFGERYPTGIPLEVGKDFILGLVSAITADPNFLPSLLTKVLGMKPEVAQDLCEDLAFNFVEHFLDSINNTEAHQGHAVSRQQAEAIADHVIQTAPARPDGTAPQTLAARINRLHSRRIALIDGRPYPLDSDFVDHMRRVNQALPQGSPVQVQIEVITVGEALHRGLNLRDLSDYYSVATTDGAEQGTAEKKGQTPYLEMCLYNLTVGRPSDAHIREQRNAFYTARQACDDEKLLEKLRELNFGPPDWRQLGFIVEGALKASETQVPANAPTVVDLQKFVTSLEMSRPKSIGEMIVDTVEKIEGLVVGTGDWHDRAERVKAGSTAFAATLHDAGQKNREKLARLRRQFKC